MQRSGFATGSKPSIPKAEARANANTGEGNIGLPPTRNLSLRAPTDFVRLAVGFVDRAQQLFEGLGFLDGPGTVESWAKQAQVLFCKQIESYTALLHDSMSVTWIRAETPVSH